MRETPELSDVLFLFYSAHLREPSVVLDAVETTDASALAAEDALMALHGGDGGILASDRDWPVDPAIHDAAMSERRVHLDYEGASRWTLEESDDSGSYVTRVDGVAWSIIKDDVVLDSSELMRSTEPPSPPLRRLMDPSCYLSYGTFFVEGTASIAGRDAIVVRVKPRRWGDTYCDPFAAGDDFIFHVDAEHGILLHWTSRQATGEPIEDIQVTSIVFR